MIRPYLSNIMNDHKNQGEQKIQLTMVINFISSKNSDEIRTMRAKSNNIEIIMGNETDEIIKEFLLQKYKEELKQK